MRENSQETLWVFVEFCDAVGRRGFRGRMERKEFEAIINGTIRQSFVPLHDTHWPDSNNGTVIAGRDGIWKRLVGTFYIPVRQIVTLAPMTDCADLFLPVADDANAVSVWEQGNAPNVEAASTRLQNGAGDDTVAGNP